MDVDGAAGEPPEDVDPDGVGPPAPRAGEKKKARLEVNETLRVLSESGFVESTLLSWGFNRRKCEAAGDCWAIATIAPAHIKPDKLVSLTPKQRECAASSPPARPPHATRHTILCVRCRVRLYVKPVRDAVHQLGTDKALTSPYFGSAEDVKRCLIHCTLGDFTKPIDANSKPCRWINSGGAKVLKAWQSELHYGNGQEAANIMAGVQAERNVLTLMIGDGGVGPSVCSHPPSVCSHPPPPPHPSPSPLFVLLLSRLLPYVALCCSTTHSRVLQCICLPQRNLGC